MPRSFLVKKWVKAEEAGYHSYRVRDPYEDDVLDISVKAVTPYTPYSPPAIPAAAAPLSVRVNNGYIHDIIPSPHTHNDGEEASRGGEEDGEASMPHLHSESAATEPSLPTLPYSLSHPHSPEPATIEIEDQGEGHLFNNGVTVGYTFDAFFISDGRSKRRNSLDGSDSGSEGQNGSEVKGRGCRQRYTCSECGKDYATSSNLSRHKQTHRSLDSQNAKKCPHCDKLYVSMPALSMHILTHDLRHICNVCGKHFSRPWLLQGHMRSHTGEKPYGCAHCGKAFADRSNLRAHMQTHSAFKHFTCNRCNKSFALKSYLNKHYESACIKD